MWASPSWRASASAGKPGGDSKLFCDRSLRLADRRELGSHRTNAFRRKSVTGFFVKNCKASHNGTPRDAGCNSKNAFLAIRGYVWSDLWLTTSNKVESG